MTERTLSGPLPYTRRPSAESIFGIVRRPSLLSKASKESGFSLESGLHNGGRRGLFGRSKNNSNHSSEREDFMKSPQSTDSANFSDTSASVVAVTQEIHEQRRFADMVADRVLSQLQKTISSSITKAIGKAIDPAMAEAMINRIRMGTDEEPIPRKSTSFGSSLSPESSVGMNFGPSHSEPHSSCSSFIMPELPRAKKQQELVNRRRRNSIGTMERMLADNLFNQSIMRPRRVDHETSAGSSENHKLPALQGLQTKHPEPKHRDHDADLSIIPAAPTRSPERKNTRQKEPSSPKEATSSIERKKESTSSGKKESTSSGKKDTKESVQQLKPVKEGQTSSFNSEVGAQAGQTVNSCTLNSPTTPGEVECVSEGVQRGRSPPKGEEPIDLMSDPDPSEDGRTIPAVREDPDGFVRQDSPSQIAAQTSRSSVRSLSPKRSMEDQATKINGDIIRSMRKERETELMKEFISRRSASRQFDEDDAFHMSEASMFSEPEGVTINTGLQSAVASPRWLQVCGILPCGECGGCFFSSQATFAIMARLGSRTWYQLLVRLMVILSLSFYIYEAVAVQTKASTLQFECDTCLQAQLMSDMPLALGSFFGLLFSDGVYKNNIIGSEDSLLVCFCRREEGLVERWAMFSRLARTEMLFLWVCMNGERLRSIIAMEVDTTHKVLHVVGFALISAVLMGLAYCLLHVCRALATMTDAFCSGFAEHPDCHQAVRDWNVLQALLRKVSYSVESVFLVMLTAALVAVCLPLLRQSSTDSTNTLMAVIPASLVLISVARISFRAGAVTYKCDRVPALINALDFGKDIDHERQYVINYILHSMAGFYVFEVRVTAEMVLKFAYVSGAIVFGVLTQLVS